MAEKCRWGILGAAVIARKNWQSLLLSGNSELVAIASRSLDKSRKFIEECQASAPWNTAPVALDSYDELLARKDIDAVYIPLPTGLRKEWVIRAAKAGKHVMAEKPVGCSLADAEAMTRTCAENGVQFMDGVMFMHSERLGQLRSVLDDGQSVGQIRRISSHFSFNANSEFHQSNIRVQDSLEPQGCLGDLGWYSIRFILWTLGYALPTAVSGRMLNATAGGVPLEFSAELFFPNQVTANFYNSFLTENQQVSTISGDRGFATVPDFVLPFYGNEVGFSVTNAAFQTVGCDFNMENHTRQYRLPEYSNSHATAQETRLFRKFSELVLSGKPDPIWPEITLKTQRVLDACLASARKDGAKVAV